jgi:hypothetical protein
MTTGRVAGTRGAAVTGAPSATAAAPAARPGRQGTVVGSIDRTVPGVGTFVGSFTPTHFSSSGGALDVTGLLSGTFTPTVGVACQVSLTLTTAVAAVQASGCSPVLDLALGPLDPDLLGGAVQLGQVHMTITAPQAAGTLHGTLLCAVADLLHGASGLDGVATLLNRLLEL